MTFEERLTAAHQELASKGVWHANYNPPLCRLLRRLGCPVKPPHYQGWLSNTLWFGVSAGLIWGLLLCGFSAGNPWGWIRYFPCAKQPCLPDYSVFLWQVGSGLGANSLH